MMGFGKLNVPGGTAYAHHYSWEKHRGPIPAELSVRHRCGNIACVNPGHLYLATLIAPRRGPRRGKQNPCARLTWPQVKAIRQSTLTQGAIAAQFGVAPSTVSSIRRRKTWR
jgi:hypothetical protein